MRLPSLLHPRPIDDEGAYGVVANDVVDGARPYLDVVDYKPPLLVWTYAAIVKATGKYNWKALHAVALIWTLATMVGLYAIGKQLFDRKTGLVAALFYSIFQPWGTGNLAFNGEMLMNLPIVWAWAIAFERSSSQMRPGLFAAGALSCAAFLLKQPAAIAAVPLGLYLLLPSYRESRDLKPVAALMQAVVFTAGFFATLALVAIVLWKQGILRDAFYWTITNHASERMFWDLGLFRTLRFVVACLPLTIGLVMAYRDKNDLWLGKNAERTALFGLLIASVIGVIAGTRFYLHYYIQLIAPLALLTAPHYAKLWADSMQPPHRILRPAIISLWLALTVIVFSILHWRDLAPRRQLSETEKYLIEHSSPAGRIFVWGQAARIYANAQRRPACRYIETAPLTGYAWRRAFTDTDSCSRILPAAWPALEQDFDRHPPAYIFESQLGQDKLYPAQDFPILARLLAEKYQPVLRTAEGLIYRKR